MMSTNNTTSNDGFNLANVYSVITNDESSDIAHEMQESLISSSRDVVNPDIVVKVPTLSQLVMVYARLYNCPGNTIDSLGSLNSTQAARFTGDFSYFVGKQLGVIAKRLDDLTLLSFQRYIKCGNSLKDWHTQGQKVRFFDRNAVCGVVQTYLEKIDSSCEFVRKGGDLYLNDLMFTNQKLVECWDDAVEFIKTEIPDTPLKAMVNYAISQLYTSGPFAKPQFFFLAGGDAATLLDDFHDNFVNTDEKDRAKFFRLKYTSGDLPRVPVVDDSYLDSLLDACNTKKYLKNEIRWGSYKFKLKEFLISLRDCRFSPGTVDGMSKVIEKIVLRLLEANVDKSPVYLGKVIPGYVGRSYQGDYKDIKRGDFVVISPSWNPSNSKLGIVNYVDQLVADGCVVYWISRAIDWDESPFGCYMFTQVAPLWDLMISVHVNSLNVSSCPCVIGGSDFKGELFSQQVKSWAQAVFNLSDLSQHEEDDLLEYEMFTELNGVLSASGIPNTTISPSWEPSFPVFSCRDKIVVRDFVNVETTEDFDMSGVVDILKNANF